MTERLSNAELDALDAWYHPSRALSEHAAAVRYLIDEVREWRGCGCRHPTDRLCVRHGWSHQQLSTELPSIYPEDWAKGP